MNIIMTLENQDKPKNANEHFKKCPACGDKNLIQLTSEVLCSECAWDSCAWSVDRGAMDNFFSAAITEAQIERRKRRQQFKNINKNLFTT